ncbi:MAG: hypothetical protein A2286_14080 [Gammaproteobacteria bacterium RIFOXYA12_FULL_61_12]|nr:MAG: hypothetical protein A2286_14080 [Gammaproteobacteria bacterium RIFOXYA12_FULL_61_12]OGT89835.1 MAG: hypothetical protein A2514_00165 [Gammaproteobacteria bacterium RIFOXYD12_FULL_61_37]
MNRAAISGRIALPAYFLLLGLLFLWVVAFQPPLHWPRPILLLTLVLPLALPVRGVLHDRPRAWFTAVFLSLIYALHGAAEIYVAPLASALPYAELGLALLLFFSAVLHLCWSSQAETPAP